MCVCTCIFVSVTQSMNLRDKEIKTGWLEFFFFFKSILTTVIHFSTKDEGQQNIEKPRPCQKKEGNNATQLLFANGGALNKHFSVGQSRSILSFFNPLADKINVCVLARHSYTRTRMA